MKKKQPAAAVLDVPTAAAEPVPFPDLNIEAVAAYRLNYLTSESVALTIKNGVVVGVKRITRAPDQHSTAIGQAQGVLWTQSRENPPVKVKVTNAE